MKKRYILFLLFALAMIAFVFFFRKQPHAAQLYDRTHDNENVVSKQQIDGILSSFEKLSYSELDEDYKKYAKADISKYKKLLKNGTYYKIPSDSIYHRIIGKVRIKNFLPKDKYYKSVKYGENKYLIWLLDKRVLYKVLEIQDALEKMGHDRNAFVVRSGYRHPRYNEQIKGASKSRHIKGEAVDMSIRDINQDGKYTDEDKQIVLKLAEKIIGNKGGVGLYPGTRSVHIDVRGYRARWNSY